MPMKLLEQRANFPIGWLGHAGEAAGWHLERVEEFVVAAEDLIEPPSLEDLL
jgi:hypothetical protein